MALHIAAQKNLIDIYKMLIEFGADPKSMDQKGRTANYYIRWQRESQSQNSGLIQIPRSTSGEFNKKSAETPSPAPIQVIHTILPKETGPHDWTKARDKTEKAKDSKARESIALKEPKIPRELKASKIKPELKSLNEPIKTKLPSVFGDSNMNSVTSNYNINSESIKNVMETTDTDTGTDTGTDTETGTVIDGSMAHGKTLTTNEQNIVKSNIPSRLPSISPPISSSSPSIDGMMNGSNENGNGNEISKIKFTNPNSDSNSNSNESDKNSSECEVSRKVHDESELESIINNDDDTGNVNVKENEKVTESEQSESERETHINNEITDDNIKEMKKVNKQHENDQKQNYKYEKINETSDVTHEIKLNGNEMDGLSNSNSDLLKKQNKQGNYANLGELRVDENKIANGKIKKLSENGKHKNNTKKNKLKI